MTRPTESTATEPSRGGGILVVSESASDAVLIKTLLSEDFDNVLVRICPEANMEAGEFIEWHPKVLLLAFREISKAEQCYLGLFRTHNAGALQPHRTLLLCTNDTVRQAFEVCRRGLFDDYVLFWPMTHDAPRLRMTVHRALAELDSSPVNAQSVMTIAAQARRILELEALLSHQPSPEQEINRYSSEPVTQKPQSTSQLRLPPVVLIVDDDEFEQQVLALILEPEGYTLRFASSGEAALRQLYQSPVDIILLDFQLPGLNGMEVTKRLKDEPRLAAIPVIMITGNSDREIVLGSRRMGAADFIVKPVERNVVLDKVRRLCAVGESIVANAI